MKMTKFVDFQLVNLAGGQFVGGQFSGDQFAGGQFAGGQLSARLPELSSHSTLSSIHCCILQFRAEKNWQQWYPNFQRNNFMFNCRKLYFVIIKLLKCVDLKKDPNCLYCFKTNQSLSLEIETFHFYSGRQLLTWFLK